MGAPGSVSSSKKPNEEWIERVNAEVEAEMKKKFPKGAPKFQEKEEKT
jgi:hypothetical protein